MTRLCLLVATVMLAVLTSGCFIVNIPIEFPPSDYQEVPITPAAGKAKILILDIDGTISSGPEQSNGLFGGTASTVNQVAEKIEKARRDSSVKAVILRIDSPGGGVTASDVTYRMLKKYKEDSGVPVYASMLDVAASGGYYIAMAADKVYAHPTTVTGSIGVVAMFPQLEDLGKKIGVSVETVKSGEMKDMGSPFHNMEPGQREILQKMIDEMYDRFVEVVGEGRQGRLDEFQIRALADGRIYTARQAADNGLIDGVLYLDELVEQVKKENGLAKAQVVIYRKTSRNSYESFYAKASPVVPGDQAPQLDTTNIGLINVSSPLWAGSQQPVFSYLWVP